MTNTSHCVPVEYRICKSHLTPRDSAAAAAVVRVLSPLHVASGHLRLNTTVHDRMIVALRLHGHAQFMHITYQEYDKHFCCGCSYITRATTVYIHVLGCASTSEAEEMVTSATRILRAEFIASFEQQLQTKQLQDSAYIIYIWRSLASTSTCRADVS